MWKRRAGRITLSGIGAAACLLTLLFLTVSGVMTAAACAPPPEGATVVVLGAALRGEQPSRMLAERLKTAARLLRDKRYHINEVCYMVGFSSTSYFAKCFQKQFGVLPKKYASE